MPFDVLPQETQTEVRFQKFADAMLRGCAITRPICGGLYQPGKSCAMGAMGIGLLANWRETDNWLDDHNRIFKRVYAKDVGELEAAYWVKYGAPIRADNDSRRFTREQIAARIAAL